MQDQITNLPESLFGQPFGPSQHVLAVPSWLASLSSLFGLVAVLALLGLSAACSTMHRAEQSRKIPESSEKLSAKPLSAEESSPMLKPGDIIDAKTGKPISFETLMTRLSEARVIYVGETHTSMEDHHVQLQILKGLYAQNPSLALALEMFPRQAQPVLDRYATGRLSEDRFLREVKWEKVWGYPFQLYRPLLNWAHDLGLKLIALNAPPDVVRKIARTGLHSLTQSERKQIASDFHLNDSKHRDYVRGEYEQHIKSGIKGFDTFYEAQLAWEETMAESLARALRSLPDAQRILVLIGNGHILAQVGVPRLTALRMGHSYKTVVTMPLDEAAQEIKPEIGDFVWITRKSEPGHRGRLGIMLRPAPSGKGMEVLGVLPDGPAAKAGIKKGDLLYLIDGIPTKSMEDLHKVLAGEKPDHELTVERDGQAITLSITLAR